MSKQHRKGPGQRSETAPPERGPEPEREPAAVGHEQKAAPGTRLDDAAEALGPASAPQLAERVALALRVAPRDAEWSARLTTLVEASHLSEERRAAVVDRLQADQALADDVSRAVTRWLGADSDALRGALVGAFDAAATTLSGRTAGAAETIVADAVTAHLGPGRAEAVAGLCRDLGALLALLWDEEEEEGAAGDYAADESGS